MAMTKGNFTVFDITILLDITICLVLTKNIVITRIYCTAKIVVAALVVENLAVVASLSDFASERTHGGCAVGCKDPPQDTANWGMKIRPTDRLVDEVYKKSGEIN